MLSVQGTCRRPVYLEAGDIEVLLATLTQLRLHLPAWCSARRAWAGCSRVPWRRASIIRAGGPDSVGHRLQEEGLVFGGDTLTMTDVAVALGLADLGDRNRVNVPKEILDKAYAEAVALVEGAIDRMKTHAGEVPLIAVGGGSILLPEKLAGVSQVYKPPHFDVANAIGAAIAQVSGEVDRVFSLEHQTREEALREAREGAFAQAIQAGAEPSSVDLIELEEVPLAYLPGNAVRIKAKAAGRLQS
jgi:N-methylhydantoinase A/oxoprolinase/acetone carboxylase beta subunit